MPPTPLAARRLSLLGCVLIAALALALPGCGEREAPESAAAQPKAKPHGAAGVGCPPQLRTFVESLEALRARLAVGLSYEEYLAQVKGLRAAYDAIPLGRMTVDCLAATGTPGEKALNQHIDAANAWGECLADAGCTTAEIEPGLQRKWRIASHFLAETQPAGEPGRGSSP